MPGVGKAIKNRIKSVTNTRKITKAVELVAAAKMNKAIASSLSSRLYAKHAWELLQNLSNEKYLHHPLLTANDSKQELLVLISSNRGLCGGYNVNVAKAALQYIQNNKDKNIELAIIGKKGENLAKRFDKKIVASFIDFSDNISMDEIGGLFKFIIDEFSAEKYSTVSLVFTDFISSIKYEPKVKQLLPINKEKLDKLIAENSDDTKEQNHIAKPVILFEPNEDLVLELVLPRLTEVQIYQALLEASASEHSARMMAMKNASDNADDMIKELMLFYNQTRQAAITQEIAEISSGAEVLK
jgi:F-type H+-transporting ATPase subunit gamma